ncbi:MAG: hypothetical protein IK106_04275 [Clostridiales bacterium]|nr:hypothetical protein [Clostridiales bacterium]
MIDKLKKYTVFCLTVAMTVPLMGCSSSSKNRKRIEKDDFIAFLEDELDAKREDKGTLSEDIYEKGFWRESETNSKAAVLSGLTFGSDGFWDRVWVSSKGIGNHSISIAYSGKRAEDFGGPFDYELNDCVAYLQCDFKERNKKTFHVPEHDNCLAADYDIYEIDWSQTYALYYSFTKEEDAMDYFTKCVDYFFTNDIEKYTDYCERIKKEREAHEKNYLVIYGLGDDNAVIKEKKIYSLEDLPPTVYELDEAKKYGHFSYVANGRDAGVFDLVKRKNDTPYFVNVYGFEVAFTMELREDTVVVFFSSERIIKEGCTEVYYDEWPDFQFEKKQAIVSASKRFGLVNPYKATIDDDLMKELMYIAAGVRGGGYEGLYFPELYLQSNS